MTDRPRPRPRLREVIADHLRTGSDPRTLAAAMVAAHAADCRDEARERDLFGAVECGRWGRR